MLAGLAAQSLTVGPAQAAGGFAAAAAVFVVLLIIGSLGVSAMNTDVMRSARASGGAAKRWSGIVVTAVGLWFVVLAVLPSPIFG